ncbi:MAG: prepilin-type N-terminal cleavage/methylation domain-containing protein [Burkholderiaceae bacterium]|nr:prepilin-type N-terminal cleavage/methylation domain-containing protein [Burkholderiaceae bacterium]
MSRLASRRLAARRSLSATRAIDPFGLTLIEMLVTLLITAILAVMGFRVIERFAISQEGLTYQASLQRSLAMTWSQIEQDLETFSFLSPRQRSAQLSQTPQGYRVGPVTWGLDKEGAFSRTSFSDSNPMVFMQQVTSVRFALLDGSDEREIGAYSAGEIERLSRQELGVAVEIQMAGDPLPIRKIFPLPAAAQ